jgi:hypothetical protein
VRHGVGSDLAGLISRLAVVYVNDIRLEKCRTPLGDVSELSALDACQVLNGERR